MIDSRSLWRPAVLTLALVAAAFAGGTWWGKRPVPDPHPPELASFLWPLLPPMEPFSLTDVRGAPFGPAALRGHWTLLFFGYTDGPDICRATLMMLRAVKEELRNLRAFDTQGQVFFVSLDAERDTPALLRRYVARFDPDFHAATGSPEQLHLLTRQVGVQFAKVSSDDPTDYWFEYSPAIVLIDPEVRVVAEFLPPLTAGAFASEVTQIIDFLAQRAR